MSASAEYVDVRDDLTGGGSLVTKEKVNLPEVLDVLIVGAGPGGTAAAFRAKELGLSALVIDRDEILGILREWVELNKKVDADYGGGKRDPFPAGGELVSQLLFGNQIPADELYEKWMKVYVERSVPAKVGFDLTGVQRRLDGVLVATCVNQRTRKESFFLARNVLLALGRGAPPKMDIPGDLRGISFKLTSTRKYVGGPACVIGGGMAAAEAVILISNAKAAASDSTEVVWSCRKKVLRNVGATIADDFFKALTLNGNIRFVPLSAALAVLKGEGDSEYLALRVDRREIGGRPTEATYLEFPKERVLVCIGADLDVKLLEALGIRMLKCADDENDYMAVSPLFESQVPNVFLTGNLLGDAYLRTADFSPEAVQTTLIDRRGIFKQCMLEGVLAIEGIRQRLNGAKPEKIAELLSQKQKEYEEVQRRRLELAAARPKEEIQVQPPIEEDRAALIGARFSRISAGPDGQAQEAEERFFIPGRVVVGRTQGDLVFPDDDQVVDNHVALEVTPEACFVTEEGMSGRSYVDVRAERQVRVGDTVLAGDQTLKIASTESIEVLDPANPEGRPINRLYAREGMNIYGRAQITPDPEARDRRLSRRHFSLTVQGGVLTLRDLGSRNGTYIPVSGRIRLNPGDELFLGNEKRLRFKGIETGEAKAAAPAGLLPILPAALPAAPAAPAAAPSAPAAPMAAAAPPKAPARPREEAVRPAPAPPRPAAPAARGGAPAVIVANAGIGATFPLDAQQTILQKLNEVGLATMDRKKIGGKVQNLWSCGRGDCGLCIVRVRKGCEFLQCSNGRKEKKTLDFIVEELNEKKSLNLELEQCRLACMNKAAGPVEIELLGDTEASD